jgi:hypothetical protein
MRWFTSAVRNRIVVGYVSIDAAMNTISPKVVFKNASRAQVGQSHKLVEVILYKTWSMLPIVSYGLHLNVDTQSTSLDGPDCNFVRGKIIELIDGQRHSF